jgi:hypothetical protein
LNPRKPAERSVRCARGSGAHTCATLTDRPMRLCLQSTITAPWSTCSPLPESGHASDRHCGKSWISAVPARTSGLIASSQTMKLTDIPDNSASPDRRRFGCPVSRGIPTVRAWQIGRATAARRAEVQRRKGAHHLAHHWGCSVQRSRLMRPRRFGTHGRRPGDVVNAHP